METGHWIAWACGLAMMISGSRYMSARKVTGPSRRALILKGGTTLLAAIPAVYALFSGGGTFTLWVMIGIMLCATADVILELHFQGGMLAFGLGHICFIAAFVSDGGIGPVHFAAWALLSLAAVFYVRKAAEKSTEGKMPFMIYGLVIAAMLTASLTRGSLAVTGAALFVLSDSILLWGLLRPKPGYFDAAIMLSYWGAQFLLGVSALM